MLLSMNCAVFFRCFRIFVAFVQSLGYAKVSFYPLLTYTDFSAYFLFFSFSFANRPNISAFSPDKTRKAEAYSSAFRFHVAL